MGCGASVDGAVAPEPEMDPFERLLKEIEEKRGELREVLPRLDEAANKWRYMNTTLAKLGQLNQLFSDDLDDELDMHKSLVYHIAEEDALDLYDSARGWGTDEEKMGRVILGRLRENVIMTDQIYKEKYGKTLEDLVRGENKSLMGLLGADSLSHFGRFLTYRTMPQGKRDALLIRRCVSGMGCSDYILCEVLSTRTNGELQAAAEQYALEFEGEDMVERIKSETGGFGKKWYGLWVDTLVEFDRDETDEVPDDVEDKAKELYDAGAGKWMGCDEQPFIDILCKANEPTCMAIAEAYENLEDTERTLAEDVEKKMGGDLEFAVLARVRRKLDFLAIRLFKACKGWGTDEECICRVLGCIENDEVRKLQERYNEMYAEEEAPFNDFKTMMESELSGSLLDAINNLLESSPPKSHWEAQHTYEPAAKAEADGFWAHLEENFDHEKAMLLGNTDIMDGPLKLLNVDEHFLCEGYDFDMSSDHDKHVPPETGYLLDSTPDDEAAAETLLKALKEAVNKNQTEAENLQRAFDGSMTPYLEKAHGMRFKDHHLRQIHTDTGAMMDFCAERNADAVHEAVEGWGTDEGKLIRVLCSLNKKQLRRVDEIYGERYGKTLRETTDSELGGLFEGSFKYFMKCAMTPPAELDAELLRESMKGLGTNDSLLCEIVCTRSNKELLAAKKYFEEANGKSVEEWVEGDTSGFYTTFLLRCLKADRLEGTADKKLADQQVDQLHDAGLGGGDKDEAVFLRILPRASEGQVRLIREAYKEKHGKEITEAIKENFDGDMERALLARVHDKLTYYATVLNGAFAGWGTDEKATSRVLGRNTKVDVRRIGERYEELFGGSLRQAIKGETSGNYQKALLTYIFAEGPPSDGDAPQGEAPPPEQQLEMVTIEGVEMPKALASGFILACREEYIDGQEGAVGDFFGKRQVPEEMQNVLCPHEDEVRDAEDKAAAIEELSGKMGL